MLRRWTKTTLLTITCLALAASAAGAQTAVVTLKSFDSLKNDLGYIAKLVGQEERFKQLDGLIDAVTQGKGLSGLDPKRPIGFYVVGVPQPGQPPKGAAFIPVTKEEEFLDLLKIANLEPEKGAEKGCYKVPTPFGQTVHMRFANDYVYVADSDALLAGTLPNPSTFLPATNTNNLIAGTFRIDQLPKELKQQFLQEVDKHIEKDSKKKSHESDAEYQFRMAATKMSRETLAMFVDEAQEAAVSFNIDQAGNNIRLDFSLTPKADSKLAGRIRNFTATQGVSPVHFEISFSKLAALLMPEGDQGKLLESARKALESASKDNSASVKFSVQGGDALHVRLDVSTLLIKVGAAFAPLSERD
jgi:hypothetical protein